MLALVRIALKRPYTFVVMAMLIVIFGVNVVDWHANRHLPGDPHSRRGGGLDL